MALRFSKMNGFIFGFQRFVWWPKWTPASSSSGTNSIVVDIGRWRWLGPQRDGEDATPLPCSQPEFHGPRAGSTLPLRPTVRDQLLQDRKADFTVVQCVTQVAALEDPGRRDPAHWQTGKLRDVSSSARPRIRQDG